MPQVTIVYGLLLIALGVGGYFGTGAQSVTALIPAFFGLPVLVAGWLARRESLLKHAMHAAAVLGLVGFVGGSRGLPGLVTVLGGGSVERPAAVASQSIMAILSLVFVVLCVRSFIAARRARRG